MKAALVQVLIGLFVVSGLGAQSRLPSLPGYDDYERMAPLIAGSWTSGGIAPRWSPDSRSFTYGLRGKTYRFDIASMSSGETTPGASGPSGSRSGVDRGRLAAAGSGRQGFPPPPQGGRGGAVEQAQEEMPREPMRGCPVVPIARGRQAFCQLSPDGTHKAFFRDRNLWIARADGTEEVAITRDGSETSRIKYGVASWVYGEELSQRTAMWWSPDSGKLAFYRFDETHVKDYYVAMNQTRVQDVLDVEAFPVAGADNPVADVFVYDVPTGRTTRLDVRDGRPFDDAVVGHYVYNVQWRRDGSELLLDRADRRQQKVEFAGCSPGTGTCRPIVRESWPTGWIDTDGAPSPIWLEDRSRFIWESARTGWSNYYLYDVDGTLVTRLTRNAFDAAGVLKIDEAAGVMFYAARDGDNFMKTQIHRVGLDGRGDVRLTDPGFSHSIGACVTAMSSALAGGTCGISPDNRYLVDVYQRHDQPPATQLLDAASGRVLVSIADGDTTKMEALGFRKTEEYSYAAADGSTTLYGQISVPAHFDPSKTYPVLVPVYGGPAAFGNLPVETFVPPNPLAEYGFVVVKAMYRGVPGTGKRGADALYTKLGRTEIDDIAAGVKALWSRPYIDRTRVGIYGTSYGGYAAAMELLRYPDVFSAASSSSPVSDWRNYDTIYTERYMGLPQDNQAAYDAGSLMTYAKDLRGRLLLYFGTADNNVHPSNSLQFIAALQEAGKSFDVQVGPDLPHSGVNTQRMMEFFIENFRGASAPRTP